MSFKGFLVCEATVAIFGLRMYMPSADGAVGGHMGSGAKYRRLVKYPAIGEMDIQFPTQV